MKRFNWKYFLSSFNLWKLSLKKPFLYAHKLTNYLTKSKKSWLFTHKSLQTLIWWFTHFKNIEFWMFSMQWISTVWSTNYRSLLKKNRDIKKFKNLTNSSRKVTSSTLVRWKAINGPRQIFAKRYSTKSSLL